MLNNSPISNRQQAQGFAEIREMVAQLVKDTKHQGRGLVFYKPGNMEIYYYSLLDLHQAGPELVGCDRPLFAELLELVVNGYDFETEYIFLIPVEEEDVVRYKANVHLIEKTQEQKEEEVKAFALRLAQENRIKARLLLEAQRSSRKKKVRHEIKTKNNVTISEVFPPSANG